MGNIIKEGDMVVWARITGGGATTLSIGEIVDAAKTPKGSVRIKVLREGTSFGSSTTALKVGDVAMMGTPHRIMTLPDKEMW